MNIVAEPTSLTDEQIDALPVGRELDALVTGLVFENAILGSAPVTVWDDGSEVVELFGPGRERAPVYLLDCACEHYAGQEPPEPTIFGHTWQCLAVAGHYSTDDGEAWGLYAHLQANGWRMTLADDGRSLEPYDVRLFWGRNPFGGSEKSVIAHGSSFPLAICRAALKTTLL